MGREKIRRSLVFDGYRETVRRTAIAYLWWTILAAAAGAVYEVFGRGVWSFYMLYFFAIPLIGGFLPSFFALLRVEPREHSRAARWCWHAGIATLAIGCAFQGVMEIFGNFSWLVLVYAVVGAAALVAAVVIDAVARAREKCAAREAVACTVGGEAAVGAAAGACDKDAESSEADANAEAAAEPLAAGKSDSAIGEE